MAAALNQWLARDKATVKCFVGYMGELGNLGPVPPVPCFSATCILMGGSFSTQGADLHCVWAAYENRKYFHRLGCLEVTPEGWPVWDTPEGQVALCQFRDNILVSTDAAPHDRAQCIEHVRTALKQSWNLEVECSCITPKQTKCTGHCCTSVTKAVGIAMVLPGNDAHRAFAERAALEGTGHCAWALPSPPSPPTSDQITGGTGVLDGRA